MDQKVKELTNHILEIRYIDSLKEKELCFELLDYAHSHNNVYAMSFAYTYLGDYFIDQNDMNKSLEYLNKAKELIDEGELWDRLSVHIYLFLGVVYEILFDEKNCINNLLEAMTIAKRVKDDKSECLILNNLGIIFQRHNNYKVALEYLEKAYHIQKDIDVLEVRSEVLSSLGDVYVYLNRLDDARRLYDECQNSIETKDIFNMYESRNNCCYYAAKKNKEKTRYWAQKLFENDIFFDDNYKAFNNYKILCEAMLKVEDQEYSQKFLDLLEKCCTDILEHIQILEDKKIEYSILFDNKEKQDDSFHRYYKTTYELKLQVNKNIAEAMKEKIHLKNMIQQKEKMKLEQDFLEKEANIDELTGIYNRRYLELSIEDYSLKEDIYLGVVMIDVDYFKEYNDHYGHIEGDMILREVASCLKNNQEKGIRCYRFGGDEFTCLCEGVTSKEIEAYIKNVQQDLYDRNIKHKDSLCSDRVTVSLGYTCQKVGSDLNIYYLLHTADEALYESKVHGRNTYRKK